MRRIVVLAVLAVVSLTLPAVSTASESTSSSVTATSLAGGDCSTSRQTINKIRRAFPRLDGTLSLYSEWAILQPRYEFEYRGEATLRGRVPRDFVAAVKTVGMMAELGKYSSVWCFKDRGTSYDRTPPRHCPATRREAVRQIGGKISYWSWFTNGGPYPRNYVLMYDPSGPKLPAFTVPRQALVSIYESGREYSTGYTVPSKRKRLFLDCFSQ